MFDGKAFGAEMTEIVKGYVDRATAPLLKRIEELEARPIAEKGDKGDPGERGEKGDRGETGVGVKDLLIDRDGSLVATFDHGGTKSLGPVVGRDGKDGADGKDGEKGEPGQDGRDGFSLDDFDIERGEDQRTLILRFQGKEVGFEYELTLQHPIYCGVFKEGQEYMPGDMVTWGGSLWHCNERTADKPDVGPWTLAVKKGRDGKDAKNG